MSDKPAQSALPALDRLLLSITIREHGGLAKAPKLRDQAAVARAHRTLAFAARLGLGRTDLGPRRRLLVDAVLVVGLRHASGVLRQLGLRSALRQIRRNADRDPLPGPEIAGYVTSAASEDQLVRLSHLLRLMRREREGVRLLVDRIASPLPDSRARRTLAALLTQFGEGKAAALLMDDESLEERSPMPKHAPSRLKFGVVVLTMLDTDVFRSSLGSLLDSDFNGRIVVVEDGNEATEQCRDHCELMGVEYLKSATWVGSAALLNQGVAHLSADVEIVLYSHNDVLWPPSWFAQLDATWEAVFDGDKVGIINLGYMQIAPGLDAGLTSLFQRGCYDDLIWILRALRQVPELMESVQDVQARAGETPFGLARDPWVDWMPDLRQMTGRFSVGASFPLHVWQEIGGFDPELVFAFDLQLLHHNLTRKRWTLFLAGSPLVHLKSSDKRAIGKDQARAMGERFAQTYAGFEQKYGWHIEHFLNLYFSESTVIHRDAIVAAANAFRFEEIDFVFDDFADRLAVRTLANCELTWCRTRTDCPYA